MDTDSQTFVLYANTLKIPDFGRDYLSEPAKAVASRLSFGLNETQPASKISTP